MAQGRRLRSGDAAGTEGRAGVALRRGDSTPGRSRRTSCASLRAMSKFIALDDRLYDYMVAQRTPDDAVLQELRAETERLGEHARMQIAPDQGTFLTLLAAALGARRAI